MKLQFFFTLDLSGPLSNMIIMAAGGFRKWIQARQGEIQAFSHTGPLFTGEPGELDGIPCPDGLVRAYFESRGKRDSQTGKTGVRGPYPWSKLANWRDAKPDRRMLAIVSMPGLTAWEIQTAYERCQWAVPNIKYAHYQIAQNARGFGFRRGIGLDKRSPLQWTCVEFDMRILPGRVLTPHFQLGDFLFDEYAPWAEKGPGFYQMLLEYCRLQRMEISAWNERYGASIGK